jgi:putative ABC transport system permease protein
MLRGTERSGQVMWRDLLPSFRHAGRGLRRSPAFASLAVVTLGLGIGALTAVFSVVDSVLLQPLPYGEPGRAVMLWSAWKDFPQTWVSWDEYELYREQVPALAEVGLYMDGEAVTLGGGEAPERVVAAVVSESLFRVLAVAPALGRTFLPAEDRPGAEAVVLISDALWRRRFAADPEVVGRSVELDGVANRVIGVMPRGFRLPTEYGNPAPAELWAPLAVEPADYEAIAGAAISPNGGSHTFLAAARLRPGVTVSQANRQLAAVVARLEGAGIYEETSGFRVTAVPLPEEITGGLRPALRVLLAAGVLVLLVACADVAGMLLVRGERRRGEVGLRTALGGGWRRLSGQLLAEGLLLGLGGAALGVALALAGVQMVRAMAPATLPRLDEVTLDLDALAFAALAGLAAALMAGAVSLVQTARVDPATLLRQSGARHGGRPAAAGGRRTLVAAQAALTVVTLCAAGLMMRSVDRLLDIDPGFRSEGVLAAQLSLPAATYPDRAAVATTYGELVRRVEAIPGVETAGVVRFLPLAGELGDRGVMVEGYQPSLGEATTAEWQAASPGYFAALRVRKVAGRLPDSRD